MKGKLKDYRFFGLYTSDYRDAIERLDNGSSGLVEPSVLAEYPIDKKRYNRLKHLPHFVQVRSITKLVWLPT